METAGKNLQGADAETRREAARALGSARTPAKQRAAQERAEKQKGVPRSADVVEKIRATQLERWEKIRAEKAATRAEAPPVVKERKPMGRPKKQTAEAADVTPKRPRGRPRKETAQQAMPEG